jgi:hypothetical protein
LWPILSIILPNGIFYGHLVHFVVIWYIFPVLIYCTDKNLATLCPWSSGIVSVCGVMGREIRVYVHKLAP